MEPGLEAEVCREEPDMVHGRGSDLVGGALTPHWEVWSLLGGTGVYRVGGVGPTHETTGHGWELQGVSCEPVNQE